MGTLKKYASATGAVTFSEVTFSLNEKNTLIYINIKPITIRDTKAYLVPV